QFFPGAELSAPGRPRARAPGTELRVSACMRRIGHAGPSVRLRALLPAAYWIPWLLESLVNLSNSKLDPGHFRFQFQLFLLVLESPHRIGLDRPFLNQSLDHLHMQLVRLPLAYANLLEPMPFVVRQPCRIGREDGHVQGRRKALAAARVV